ncbi:PAS domain S-box protein [Kiritimatiellota bacterium B12222]|nr:PAS domain S-box protein [Kiritimatiellota bacterium B12222]
MHSTKKNRLIDIDKTDLFRHAFEGANNGMTIVDVEGNIVKVNHQMTLIFGYSSEELEAMNVNDIAHPDDKELSPKFIRKSMDGEISSGVFEKRYLSKGGEIVHGQIASTLLRNLDGKAAYYISHVTDITQRVQAEQQRDELIKNLQQAMTEIKVLKGILPICSYCKGIRNDEGAWNKMESYISAHSEVQFSHGICPKCFNKEIKKIP